ncbi:YjbF family lipoprotein [Yoonia sp. BS5-3]|uniref:YjbF family lipoprotein n=1 Tax=Yoonia phaeophyticola TaxID=3137369 RepID=A0ABZ2V2K9_9RHOB
MRLLFLLLLAACAPAPDGAALRATFDAKTVARLQVPVLLLSNDDFASALVPVAQDDGAQVWQSRDPIQISDQSGVVIATRGLGHDLMAGEVADAVAALQSAGGVYTRVWVHLDGDLRLVRREERCRLSPERMVRHQASSGAIDLRVVVEICGDVDPITNIYHVDGDGLIWWSQQWISPALGSVTLERVTR